MRRAAGAVGAVGAVDKAARLPSVQRRSLRAVSFRVCARGVDACVRVHMRVSIYVMTGRG